MSEDKHSNNKQNIKSAVEVVDIDESSEVVDSKKTNELDSSDEVSDSKSSGGFIILIVLTLLIFAFLILMGVFKYHSVEQPEYIYYSYNGFDFFYDGTVWKTQISYYAIKNDTIIKQDLVNFSTNYGPKEVENIPSEGDYVDLILNSTNLSLSFDPEIGQQIAFAGIEIKKTLVYLFKWDAERVVIASLENNTEFPVITCDDSSENLTVISFELGNETKIEQEDYCVRVEANESVYATKAADKIVFELLGIIE